MRVRAKNEDIAKFIRHPHGSRFREGVAEWPDDQFTQRRIRDGDVTVVEAEGAKAIEAKPERARAPKTE